MAKKQDEITQFFEVIYPLPSGRLDMCKHVHRTMESAQTCAKELKAVGIVEWNRDARPQWTQHEVGDA